MQKIQDFIFSIDLNFKPVRFENINNQIGFGFIFYPHGSNKTKIISPYQVEGKLMYRDINLGTIAKIECLDAPNTLNKENLIGYQCEFDGRNWLIGAVTINEQKETYCLLIDKTNEKEATYIEYKNIKNVKPNQA